MDGMSLPRNDELATMLELLADLLELDGADAFRLTAYRRAATRVRESAVPVAQLAIEGKATRLSGIGGTIEKKIVEYSETGDLQALAKLRDRIPPGLVEVMHVPGLGPKTARRLWQELGVSSADELRAAAEAHRLRELPGLGAKTEERVLQALTEVPANGGGGSSRALLGRALPFVSSVVAELAANPLVDRVSEAGSVRRCTETVRDLDVIATATDGERADRILHDASLGRRRGRTRRDEGHCRLTRRAALRSPRRSSGVLRQPAAALHRVEGSQRRACVRTRSGAGCRCPSTASRTSRPATSHAWQTEEELYAYLGYTWIPPELRENSGELDAARAGELPALVERADVLGDLHIAHGLVGRQGDARGDRGRRPGARPSLHRHLRPRTRLRDGRLERQAEQIAALSRELEDIRVLSGVEVDIRVDGSLDLDDDMLADRDWVVASIHFGFPRPARDDHAADPRRHREPARRLHRPSRPVARSTGAAPTTSTSSRSSSARGRDGNSLEINGQPDRLDLRDTHARLAAEAGVHIVVSSDAHSVGGLDYLDLAVSQARRAWLTAAQVVNTRPWAELTRMRA